MSVSASATSPLMRCAFVWRIMTLRSFSRSCGRRDMTPMSAPKNGPSPITLVTKPSSRMVAVSGVAETPQKLLVLRVRNA